MKRSKPCLLIVLPLLLFSSLCIDVAAQPVMPPAKVKIAVLSPLYLDSAFDGYSYKLGNSNMPQYVITGLDFYNGVMLAVDSLNKENIDAEVWIYDTKKKGSDINTIMQSMKFLNFSLIIASLTSGNEQKTVSDFSFANNIPVVSVTFPNDAGLSANPYYIMLNPTLKTHVNSIYQYVQQNFVFNKPLFVTKYGSLENKIAADFRANDSLVRNHFAYRMLALTNDIEFDKMQSYLDSTKPNTIICGSMDDKFVLSLVKAIGENPQYRATLIGMPNWDGMRKIFNNDYDNIDIVYTTPFNYSITDNIVQNITAKYKAKFFARPSDMVYKGFEAMYHNTHLVLEYGNQYISHASDTTYKWKNHFMLQPVVLNSQSQVPDYLENKNLYFIKKNGQAVVSVTQLK